MLVFRLRRYLCLQRSRTSSSSSSFYGHSPLSSQANSGNYTSEANSYAASLHSHATTSSIPSLYSSGPVKAMLSHPWISLDAFTQMAFLFTCWIQAMNTGNLAKQLRNALLKSKWCCFADDGPIHTHPRYHLGSAFRWWLWGSCLCWQLPRNACSYQAAQSRTGNGNEFAYR